MKPEIIALPEVSTFVFEGMWEAFSKTFSRCQDLP